MYNIQQDPGETTDLASAEPLRFQRMLSAYERYAHENKVLPVPAGYGHIKQVAINVAHSRLRDLMLIFLITMLLIAPIVVLYCKGGRGTP